MIRVLPEVAGRRASDKAINPKGTATQTLQTSHATPPGQRRGKGMHGRPLQSGASPLSRLERAPMHAHANKWPKLPRPTMYSPQRSLTGLACRASCASALTIVFMPILCGCPPGPSTPWAAGWDAAQTLTTTLGQTRMSRQAQRAPTSTVRSLHNDRAHPISNAPPHNSWSAANRSIFEEIPPPG